jgi:hypothetical protein
MSEWRTNISAQGGKSKDQLDTEVCVLPDKSKWITNMSQSSTDPLLAISTASSINNLFVVQYSMPNSKNMSKPVFNIESTYTSQSPLYSTCWNSNNRILVTTNCTLIPHSS